MKNLELYENKILAYYNKDIISEYSICDYCIEIVQKNETCELSVSINKNSHIIDNVKFRILNEDKYLKGVMNAFYKVIVGLPILEANDHSLLRLENLLRDKDVEHTIKGLIMPTNSFPLFSTPLSLIRKIYTEYCTTQGYNPIVNTYISNKVNEWKKLDTQEKEKIVFGKISEFCRENGIEDYDIKLIGDSRIEFFVNKSNYPELGRLLLNMETKIQDDLNFSLEIMYIEKKDANRKRKKKYEE